LSHNVGQQACEKMRSRGICRQI